MDTRAIGIFDSGSGGLSIWLAIRSLLPHQSMIYVGDHGNNPYSDKPVDVIKKRAIALSRFLLKKHVKLIVVACNTVTVSSIGDLRNIFPDVPIVGVVPVVKTASQKTKTHTFGVLSTEFTSKSQYQKDLIAQFAPSDTVISLGNTELVKYIENGELDSALIKQTLSSLFGSVPIQDMDVLALGCTHFPFIKQTIRKVVGEHIQILDSGAAVARQVQRILIANAIDCGEGQVKDEFITTGEVKIVRRVMSKLLGKPLVVKHEDIL